MRCLHADKIKGKADPYFSANVEQGQDRSRALRGRRIQRPLLTAQSVFQVLPCELRPAEANIAKLGHSFLCPIVAVLQTA
jgi:hypothetical protein